jgi:acetyl esterase
MPLHADVEAMLARLAALEAPPFSEQSPDEARRAYASAPKPAGDPLTVVEDRALPGPAGPLPVRCYATSAESDLGVVVFFHGGGWVLSSVDGHDSLARRLAARSGALVVSVEYRLAPEHPFPAPHEDAWAATAWLAEHAGQWGGDPTRLAVAGDSAGGNLAAGVALRARDEGLDLAHQLLMYPCLDCDTDRPSYRDNAEGYFLTAANMGWFWDQYVPVERRRDPRAVPMRAEDLSGLAPALIQTAEYDPLRDEGEAYGERLAAADVPVVVTRYDGVIHGFISRWDQIAGALPAHDEAGEALRHALGGGPLGPVLREA